MKVLKLKEVVKLGKETESKPKKRGNRKKKFGDEESKVISFRIGKDTYDKNKEEIREKINNVIKSEATNKKTNNFLKHSNVSTE